LLLLVELCVTGPAIATMLVMCLVVIGWFSYSRLGPDLLPKIGRSTVTITTQLAGPSPEEMEIQMT
jgi:multidrug efflux pump subunit AcrB